MREAMDGSGKSYAKKKPGQYSKGGGKGLQGDALVGRVSQSTINDIKRMGMAKALRLAGENGKTAGGVAREFQEGVRRMYGANRLAEAKAKYSAAPASKPAAKSADAARAAASKPAPSKPAAKPSATSRARGYAQPKPTAQQIAQGKARAGGNVNFNPTPKPAAKVETPAQKAAKAAAVKKRREAAAKAVKAAGGRTH